MEFISDRISIKKNENETSIVILSFSDKLKNKLLLTWLILWTAGGLIVLSQFFTFSDPNTKIAIIVWMGFWVYFEFKIWSAYLWRKNGKETIRIKNDKLYYKKDSLGTNKFKTYGTDFIKNLKLIEAKDDSFLESLNNSYWVIGGEKIAFDFYGKKIKLGIQLSDKEAKSLLKVIKTEIESKN
ncbi:MAG: hypothetical protein WBM13_12105 [Bacteroidia bacterium]